MNVPLDYYRIFAAIVKEKSFSAAAHTLYITQPAVSQAVRRMEKELGARLFLRTKKGVTLTTEGEILSGYVSSALNLFNAGEQRVKKLAALSAGTLRIGASDTISRWFLAPYIEEFHRLYPNISISITNRTSTDILKLLSQGQVDIGYVNLPVEAEGLYTLSCRTVNDVFIAGEKYAALKERPLSLFELSAYPLIMLERASSSRRWVDRFFLSHGIALKAQIELGAHDLIAEYVRIGLGIGCVIEQFSSQSIEKDNLFTVRLNNPIPSRSIGVSYPIGIELSAAAKKFIAMTNANS